MAEIQAFRGYRYNRNRIGNLEDVIAPPYDVISAEQKKAYLARSPYNVVRLILPDGENPYSNANHILHNWIRDQVLMQDREPAIYCYHQTFKTPDGENKTRKGFLALIRLENFDQGVVLPHEATLYAPKEDRLQILRATRTNFSPIFSLYSDPEQAVESVLDPLTSALPEAQVTASDGVINTLWVITNREAIHAVKQIMKQRWVLIADGHHRYESCLMYRNEMRERDSHWDAPFQFTLMFFSNLNHPGITVLPYNRAVLQLPDFNGKTIRKKASEYFHITAFDDRNAAQAALKSEGREHTAFLTLFRDSSEFYLFRLRPDTDLNSLYPAGTPSTVQHLDVNVLHRLFIERILTISQEDIRQQKYLKYCKDEKEEMKEFEEGKLQIAFFLNPTKIEQVVEVSKAGRNMPQKSTYFYPKLMTGFVMRRMQDE